MLEFKYDTQLLIEGENLDEDEISEYFTEHFKGDCLLAVGDDELIKIHFHTNEPWKVLEYCASLGEIYDIVVEDMDRQSRGPVSYTHLVDVLLCDTAGRLHNKKNLMEELRKMNPVSYTHLDVYKRQQRRSRLNLPMWTRSILRTPCLSGIPGHRGSTSTATWQMWRRCV